MTKRIPFITDELAEYIGESLTIDIDQVLKAANDSLAEPSDSYWRDKDLWDTKTMMFATPDIALTNDDASGYSNYRSIYAHFKDVFPGEIEEVTFGHWTYSRFLALEVTVIDDNGAITKCFAKMVDVAKNLQDYGIFDDDDYLELCWKLEEEYIDEVASDWGVDASKLYELLSQDIITVEGSPNDLVIRGIDIDPSLAGLDYLEACAAFVNDTFDALSREQEAIAHGRVELF